MAPINQAMAQGVKVKNTFIEGESFDEDRSSGDEDADWLCTFAKRQQSEPAPWTSKLLGTSVAPNIVAIRNTQELSCDSLPVVEFSDEDEKDSGSASSDKQQAAAKEKHGGYMMEQPKMTFTRKDAREPEQELSCGSLPWVDFSDDEVPEKGSASDKGAVADSVQAAPQPGFQGMQMGFPGMQMGFPGMQMGFPGMQMMPIPMATHANPEWMQEWMHVTTVMIRNLPNKVSQQMLLSEVDGAGFLNSYDFVYLPIDADTKANKGYAFMNFCLPAMAGMFKMHFEGKQFSNCNTRKVLSVVPAALQGFQANYAHYSKARVRQLDSSSRPLFGKAGEGLESSRAQSDGWKKRESLIDKAAKHQQARLLKTNHHSHQQEAEITTTTASSAGGVAASAGQPKAQARFCPFCGGSVQASFKFCQFCGSGIPSDM